MSLDGPILVTGAAGRMGGVGGAVVEMLRQRNLPVRALVRREDERADALRAIGAEVVVGDLTRAGDVARALAGCRRMFFGMSVSAQYLEATVIAAAVARERGDLEVFVNISQMTVSQMSLTEMTDSPQQRQHWLGEQVLNWSGLARRARPGHGLSPELLLFCLGCRIDRQGRHDPAALWLRANIARRRPGRGRGDRRHSGKSRRSHRQNLRTDRAAVPGHGTRTRRNIPRRWAAPSPMSMCPWSSGGTRSFAPAICPIMSSSTC